MGIGVQQPPNYLRATNIYLITSFATNVHPERHKWRYKRNRILLSPLAALFCTPFLAIALLRIILAYN